MRIPKTIFASLSVALLCIGAVTVARADTITFIGTSNIPPGPPRTVDVGRCGASPPFFLVTSPQGTGPSNL